MRHDMLFLGSCLALVAACGAGVTSTGTTGPGGSTTASGTTSSTAGPGGSTTGTTTASGTTSTGAGGAGGSGCAMDPTFAEVLSKPLSGCAGFEPPCHNASQGNLHIDPTDPAGTWAALVNVKATIVGAGKRVVPGDPAHSFIYRKLTDDLKPTEGGPMPAPGTGLPGMGGVWKELPADEIEMMRCWILAGAKNN